MGDPETGPSFVGDGSITVFGMGTQDIGSFVFMEFTVDENRYNLSTNLCLKEIQWTNNVDGTTFVLGEEYLGYGLFLVKDGDEYLGELTYIGSDPSDLLDACEGDCDDDSDCSGDLLCFHGTDTVVGCAGTHSTDWDYCGYSSVEETALESAYYQQSQSVDGLYLPSTPYRYQLSTLASHQRTHMDVTAHICASDSAFTLEDDSDFGVTVSGRNNDGAFESSEFLSLSTGSPILNGEYRKYSLSIPMQFSEINVLTFTIDGYGGSDMTCIDTVEVNGKEAFLTETFLGEQGSDCEGLVEECPSSLFAVLSWPICGMEVIAVRIESTVASTSDEEVAAAIWYDVHSIALLFVLSEMCLDFQSVLSFFVQFEPEPPLRWRLRSDAGTLNDKDHGEFDGNQHRDFQ